MTDATTTDDPISNQDATTTEATRELIPLDDTRQQRISQALRTYIIEKYHLSVPKHPMADATAADLIHVAIPVAAWRVKNGTHDDGTQRYATGQFYLQESTHSFLKNHGGLYFFVVYERRDDGVIPLYERRAYPEAVERVTDDVDWGSRKRVPWPDLLRGTGGEL